MKGIIFTVFLEMVESRFGLEVVDQVLESNHLPSGGVYTSVGTYDFVEMLRLLRSLSENVQIPEESLLHAFGNYLFQALIDHYPEVVADFSNPMDLLAGIEDHIHTQVLKLYPNAELPTIRILEHKPHSMTLLYESSRGLYRLAHGLIESAFAHFNTTAGVKYELLNPEGTRVKFQISQHV